MAETVSDKELEAKRAKVAKLRDQITDAESKAAAQVRDQENTIEAAKLDAEAARLELQLEEARQRAKSSTVKEGVAGPVESAKEQMKRAEAQLAAAKGDGEPGAPKDPPPDEDSGDKADDTDKDKE